MMNRAMVSMWLLPVGGCACGVALRSEGFDFGAGFAQFGGEAGLLGFGVLEPVEEGVESALDAVDGFEGFDDGCAHDAVIRRRERAVMVV